MNKKVSCIPPVLNKDRILERSLLSSVQLNKNDYTPNYLNFSFFNRDFSPLQLYVQHLKFLLQPGRVKKVLFMFKCKLFPHKQVQSKRAPQNSFYLLTYTHTISLFFPSLFIFPLTVNQQIMTSIEFTFSIVLKYSCLCSSFHFDPRHHHLLPLQLQQFANSAFFFYLCSPKTYLYTEDKGFFLK